MFRLRSACRPLFIAAALVATFPLLPAALAQTYPAKPVRIVVPYAPGGGTDILGRLFAQKLTEAWGQSVVVENRPGADGIIGTEMVVASPPDGHSLVLVVAAHVINPFVKAKMPFDPIKDLTPITLVAASPWVVVVNPTVAAGNIRELIALAKAQPGRLSFGSSEPSSRLAGEQFKANAGVNLLHVPYKGGAQIMTDLLGGHIQVGFTSVLTVLQHYKSGKLKVLGVAGKSRWPSMPDVPTVVEAGLPGYETSAWYGLFGPAGLSPEVARRIQGEFARIVRLPDVAERLTSLGAIAAASAPEDFAAFARAEHAKYGKLVKDAGIQPE